MSINIRYRKNSNGLFSGYLDIYSRGKRQYFYPDIIVTQDYSQAIRDQYGKIKRDIKGKPLYPKIQEEDKDKIKILERLKLEKEVDLANNRLGFKKSGQTIFIHNYFKKIATETKYPLYNTLAKKLEEYLGSRFSITDFDENRLKDFLNHSRKKGCKEVSVQTYYYGVTSGLQKAVREKVISVNPKIYLSSKEKPVSDEKKREFLTLEEIKKLKATPFPHKNKQIGDAFLFACLTGLRISDIISRKHSDVKDGVLEYRQKKSSKDFHYLPLNKQALEIIDRQTRNEKSDTIFDQLPKYPSSCNYLFKIWAKEAGINKHITWHVGRHTHATLLLKLGTDVFTVSKILGHSSVNITQRYAKVLIEAKKAAVERIPDLAA